MKLLHSKPSSIQEQWVIFRVGGGFLSRAVVEDRQRKVNSALARTQTSAMGERMKIAYSLIAFLSLSSFLVAEDQTICPIMVETEVDPLDEEFVDYDGVRVWMCCGSCVKAWDVNPNYFLKVAMELELLPQLADQKEALAEELAEIELLAQRFCPLRTECVIGPESPSIEYQGKKIYFFKERDIERRWGADPDGAFAEARAAGLLPQFDEEASDAG